VKKPDGKVSSIRELLFGARFGIDCSQREYSLGLRRDRSSNNQYTTMRREQKTLNALDVL